MHTFTVTLRLFYIGLLLLVEVVANAQTPPDGPLISTSINGLETIDNGQLKVGVDSRYGGAITWLSAAGRGNMVNNHDRGRQIQIALYGLPEDFSKNGNPPWAGLGWNPIQAGDSYNNPSQVIAFEKHTNMLYVKTIPKQFAYNNMPGEATIEHWIRLSGNVVKVHARIVMNRSDRTAYMARAQEWPCAYLTAPYRHIWTYRGEYPYTYGALTEVTPPTDMESVRPVTEPWMAATDDSGFGMAIFEPKNYQWTKAYFGKDYNDPDEHIATSSYIAATQLEQLDYNMVHEWDYEFVVGNLYTIRSYIYAQPRLDPTINYRFDTSRKGWHYFATHDSGWPIQGQLNVTLDNRDRNQIKSPVGFWRGNDNRKLYLRAAFTTQHNRFRLHWRQLPDYEFFTLNDRYIDFPIQNDGQMRTYEIDLSQKAGWIGATITQLNLRPPTDGPTVNGSVRIEWLSTTPDGSAAPPSTTVVTPPSTNTTTTPPVTAALQLLPPQYDCTTGALTFKTTGGDGTVIEYAGGGVSDWTTNPNQQIALAIRQNPRPVLLLARQGLQLVTYTFDLAAACSAVVIPPPTSTTVTQPPSTTVTQPPSTTTTTTPPPATTTITQPTSPTYAALQVVSPGYNCYTGELVFKTTGGDGTIIEYAGVGITGWTTNLYQLVGPEIRQNPRQIMLLARQSGQVATFMFDLPSACPPTSTDTNPPPKSGEITSGPLQLVAPTYNCATGDITFKTTGGDGTVIEYAGISITGWTTNSTHRIDPAVRQDTKLFTLFARQSGLVVMYVFDLSVACPGSAVVTPPASTTIISSNYAPLQLLSPDYNCATGAITFKTTGGNGTLIEYMAIGVTPWTTNPSQRVDAELQQDPKPITLIARQSGQVAMYVFNLAAYCSGSRAAIATMGVESEWQMRVLGNPVVERLTMELIGYPGHPLTIDLLTASGAIIENQVIPQPQTGDRYIMDVGKVAPGLLLIRVHNGSEQRVLKALKQ